MPRVCYSEEKKSSFSIPFHQLSDVISNRVGSELRLHVPVTLRNLQAWPLQVQVPSDRPQ
jgi:hypothetical protein